MQRLISKYIEPGFLPQFLEQSCLKGTPIYERLRLGDIYYYLHCFELVSNPSDGSEEIYDDDLPNYYNYKDICPELDILKEEIDVIQAELQCALSGTFGPKVGSNVSNDARGLA